MYRKQLKLVGQLFLILFIARYPVIAQEVLLDTEYVTATRISSPIEGTLADVSVIYSKKIEHSYANVGELISKEAGLEFTNNGARGGQASLGIRGASNNHTVILVDGVRTGSITTGSPNFAYLPVSQIDKIEILRGPASSLYGADSIGGVVQIFTKKGKKGNHYFVETGAGSFKDKLINIVFNGKVLDDKFQYSLSGAYRKSDEFSSLMGDEIKNHNEDKDGYERTDSSLRLEYEIDSNNKIGITSVNANGRNRYDSAPTESTPWNNNWTEDYIQEVSTNVNTIYSINNILPNWISTLRYGGSRDKTSNRRNNTSDGHFNSKQRTLQWQNNIYTPIGNFLLATEQLKQYVNSSTNYDKTDRTINSLQIGYGGEINDHNWQINVRHDKNSQFGSQNTGLLAYGYDFTSNISARVAVSTGFKAPSFNELYYPNFGNADLKPEESISREIGIKWNLINNSEQLARVSATLFKNNINNLIEYQTIGNNYMPVNVAKSEIKGVSVDAVWKIGNTSISGNINYQDPRNRGTDNLLRRRAKIYGAVAINQDLGNFNLQGEFVGNGKRFEDADNEQQMGSYGLLNALVSYRLSGGAKKTGDWKLSLRVDNIFDKKYQTVRNYATGGRRFFVALRYE